MLIYQSSTAADYVVGGLDVLPIGGFSGNAPYPSADQIRTLIESGKVSRALVPTEDALAGNDPRVEVIRQLCLPPLAGADANVDLYFCGQS